MLKLIYIESDFCLELLHQSLEGWVNTRSLLALRSGTSLWVDPCSASFLLPLDLEYLSDLKREAQRDKGIIEVCLCDDEYVEVSLEGTWVSSEQDSEEGVFVTRISDRAEFFLYKLWLEAQTEASVIIE